MNNIFLLLREYNNNLCMKKFKFFIAERVYCASCVHN